MSMSWVTGSRSLEPLDALAGVLDHAGVDEVESGQMRLHGVALDRIVVPRAVVDDRAGRAQRRLTQRRNALGHLVGVSAHQFDLRVDHLVHADEVRADDVPVHVLERQVQVVVPAQAFCSSSATSAPSLSDMPGTVNSVIKSSFDFRVVESYPCTPTG